MGWLRRRRTPASPELGTALVLVPRVERILVSLAVHAAQLDDRLERLETRVADAVDAAEDAPSHGDVLAVRLHSARLAAELARVTVELRAEIDQLANRPDRLHDHRVRTLAESVLDLSDRIDTLPSDLPRAATA